MLIGAHLVLEESWSVAKKLWENWLDDVSRELLLGNAEKPDVVLEFLKTILMVFLRDKIVRSAPFEAILDCFIDSCFKASYYRKCSLSKQDRLVALFSIS
jgi:hypothetical protein